MDLGLRGRTAIVSGASSGLGLASADALAAEGANVTMFARRREELELEANRLGALAVRGDVTNASDLERLVDLTLQAFGGVDIVVWNSGGPPAGHGLVGHRRRAGDGVRPVAASRGPPGALLPAAPANRAPPAA